MGKEKKRQSLRTKLMGINISITLASFILCGFLFVLAVYVLVGNYVRHDFDFFLTEVSDNLNGRLEYLEDVIYKVRDSQEMTEFLLGEGDTEGKEKAEEDFRKAADINYAKNKGDGGNPIVEKMYLFHENGIFLSDFYYAMIYSEIKESDAIFVQIWKAYKENSVNKEGFRDYCYVSEDKAYFAYAVLDDTMEEQGVLIFEVNLLTVAHVMEELKNYDKAFWYLYNDSMIIDGFASNQAQQKKEEFSSKSGHKPYVTTVGESDYRVYGRELCLNMRVAAGIPEYQAMIVLYNSSYIYMIGMIIILIAGVISFGMFTYKITKPVAEVTERIKRVQEGDFETKLPDYDNKEFHEISQVFNQMTDHIHYLIKQVYEKQISVKEMELKFLQTQMNPHFMFNVLNALALQAKIDGNEEICKLISTFSQLIQARIYRSDSEKVKVRQELEYVKYYLEIQKFRYGDRLSYCILTKDEEILDCYIPKLCIQMIAENAVVHGLEPKLTDGSVSVVISRDQDRMLITITDDGVGFLQEGFIALPMKEKEADREHNHVGLNNVHHIIQLMYGKEYGVTVFSKKNGGTEAKILLPLDQNL